MRWFLPERELIVCYFTQSRGGMSTFRFEELIAPLVGLEPPVRRHRLSADQLRSLVGDYQEKGTGKRAWLTSHGKRLRLELAGQAALLPLWPDDRGRWAFGESAGVSVSFDKDSSGTATSVRLMFNDNALVVFERSQESFRLTERPARHGISTGETGRGPDRQPSQP